MADSRFDIGSFIVGKDQSYIQANLKALKERATNSFLVSPMYAFNLSMISQKLYGTPVLKYLLIYVNDIVDISVVDMGYTLNYPSMKDIISVLNESTEAKE